MHLSHSVRIKTPSQHFKHSFMLLAFRPDDTASKKSLNEGPEIGRFGIFVNVVSEDVTYNCWVGYDELPMGWIELIYG